MATVILTFPDDALADVAAYAISVYGGYAEQFLPPGPRSELSQGFVLASLLDLAPADQIALCLSGLLADGLVTQAKARIVASVQPQLDAVAPLTAADLGVAKLGSVQAEPATGAISL